MADNLTPAQRRRCMSRIKSKNTKPELALRQALWREGLRYRLHSAALPGKPDLIFKTAKVAVFVDGCFWHGCPRHGSLPQSNRDFWRNKIYRNIERDRRVAGDLQTQGWKVLRFWQHELTENLTAVSAKIKAFVKPRNGAERASYRDYYFQARYTIADQEGVYKTRTQSEKTSKKT